MLVEGFLNVSWGVHQPIRLKMQDEKQTLPQGPQSPISPLDKRFLIFILISISIIINLFPILIVIFNLLVTPPTLDAPPLYIFRPLTLLYTLYPALLNPSINGFHEQPLTIFKMAGVSPSFDGGWYHPCARELKHRKLYDHCFTSNYFLHFYWLPVVFREFLQPASETPVGQIMDCIFFLFFYKIVSSAHLSIQSDGCISQCSCPLQGHDTVA